MTDQRQHDADIGDIIRFRERRFDDPQDIEDYYQALAADYDEASPEQGQTAARLRDPLLFGRVSGEWQDGRDQDREDQRENERRDVDGFRWSA